MENFIIILILALVVFLGLRHARKHFRGGGCCGSGSNTIRSHKELTQPQLGEKQLTVQGMHCENCQARVENALNRLDGVACTVNLRKKTATVRYSTPVPDDLLKQTVESLGYSVTQIR